MAEPVRVPLIISLSQRNFSDEKDGLTANIFYDKARNGVLLATKRPGLISYNTGSTVGNGIFSYGGILYIFRNDSFTPTEVTL